MTETVIPFKTKEQFRYWMFKAGLNETSAASVLGVDVKTIQGYMYGHFRIDEQLTEKCKRYQGQKLNLVSQIGED